MNITNQPYVSSVTPDSVSAKPKLSQPDPISPVRGIVCCLAMICALWSGFVGGQTYAQIVKPEITKRDGNQETRFALITSNLEFHWCGREHLALNFHGKDGGIRLLNIASGQLREITNDTNHASITCTPDGRYIFFTNRRVHRGIEVIDLVTGKQDVVSAKLPKGYSAIEERRARVSPSGRHLVGSDSLEKSISLADR